MKKVWWEFCKLEAAFSEVQPFLSEPVTRPVGLLRQLQNEQMVAFQKIHTQPVCDTGTNIKQNKKVLLLQNIDEQIQIIIRKISKRLHVSLMLFSKLLQTALNGTKKELKEAATLATSQSLVPYLRRKRLLEF